MADPLFNRRVVVADGLLFRRELAAGEKLPVEILDVAGILKEFTFSETNIAALISKDAGNILVRGTDKALFVPAPPAPRNFTTQPILNNEISSLTITGAKVANHTIALIKLAEDVIPGILQEITSSTTNINALISADPGNIITPGSDHGLFAPAPPAPRNFLTSPLQTAELGDAQVTKPKLAAGLIASILQEIDSSTVNVNAMISADSGNIIREGNDHGLFAPAPPAPRNFTAQPIQTAEIGNAQVTKEKLADSAVTGDKLLIDKGLTFDSVTKALSVALQSGGGLAFDGSKRVYVDFSIMPTDKFQVLLQSLHVPIWLTANRSWYVRTDGSDANDGSANTPEKAFRTIQKALTYVCDNFNFGAYTATISVGPGTFSRFTVPKYTASTGALVVRGAGPAMASATIVETTDEVGVTTIESMGQFSLIDFTLISHANSNDPAVFHNWQCLNINPSSTAVARGCHFIFNENGTGMGRVTAIYVRGGRLSAYGCHFSMNLSPGLSASRSAVISLNANAVVEFVGNEQTTTIDGACRTVFSISRSSRLGTNDAYPTPHVVTGNIIGRKFTATAYSTIMNGANTRYPGTIDGTLTDSVYS